MSEEIDEESKEKKSIKEVGRKVNGVVLNRKKLENRREDRLE